MKAHTHFTRGLAALVLTSGLSLAGCSDDDTSSGAGGSPPAVTWYRDVQPIVAGHCWGCHNTTGDLTFSLQDYESAKTWSTVMVGPLQGSSTPPYSMPPFGARDTDECATAAPFVDDPRLTAGELETLLAWVDAGAPEGDATTAAALPDWGSESLEGGNLQTLTSAGFTLPEGQLDDDYRCFSLDPGLTETGWVTGIEAQPDNADVVHHIVLFADPTGASADLVGPDGSYQCFGSAGTPQPSVMYAWAPGGQPLEVPANAGLEIPAGGRMVMQVHYHPTGSEATDRSKMVVRWADSEPARRAEMRVFGGIAAGQTDSPSWDAPPFEVPANATGHVERWRESLEVPPNVDVRVWSVFPHMHLLGTDIHIELERASSSRECLVHVPQWDFNWQRTYVYDGSFDELPRVQPGDQLNIRCTFDNSRDNPFVDEALDEQGQSGPVDVGVGEDTLDEMCTAIIGVVY